jgi:hypothetical protein
VYTAAGSARRTTGYVAVTVGGVGLAVGVVSGVLAMQTGSELETQCPGGVCVPKNQAQRSEHQQQLDQYSLFKTASTIGFSVGVAGLAAGAYLLFIAKDPQPGAVGSRSPRLVPLIGMRSLGVAGSF